MKYSLTVKTTIATIVAAMVAACGGGSGAATVISPPVIPPVVYEQPDSSICDASLGAAGGLLCAIQPSRLDADSRDAFGNGNLADLTLGFGYHVVAFPPTGTDIQGVYIHLTGSYGRPYNQASDRFGSADFLDEALSSGYVTMQVAYNNRFAVNIDECGGDVSRLNVDNCSGDVRMEKIVGADVSTVTDTPLQDSIEFRIVKLAEFLDSQGVRLPFSIVSNGIVNWPSLRVGGHSQGATHALYLSKYFFAGHACLLAGGFDVADTVPSVPVEDVADWLLDTSVSLDLDEVRAVVSVDDSSFDSFVRSFNLLGFVEGTEYTVFSGDPYADSSGGSINGHSAALNDPRYESLRFDACFSN